MATKKKISELPIAGPITGAELVPIVQDGTTRKATVSELVPTPTYTYPGGTTRTVNNKLNDLVSVKDFGATGNGVTDDTSAFTAAAATGRPVFVPAGSYSLTQRVDGLFFTDGSLTFPGVGYVLARNLSGQYARAEGGVVAPARWHEASGGTIGTRSINETYTLKVEAEAPFDAVAIALQSHEAVPGTAYTAVVAATETFSTATQDSRYRPVVGAATFNSLRGAGVSYGWDAVTWGGAANITVPAGTTSVPGVVVSDFMPINSVPRADGGTRPLLLLRVHHDGATTGSHTFCQRDFAPWHTASTNNRGRLMDVGTFAGNAVGTLSNTIAVSVRSFLMYPIYRYRSNVVTVACVGDSISQGLGSASGLDNWCKRACADVSTIARPVVPMNMGMSGSTTTTFLSHAKTVFPLAKPTIAFYSPFSPNDAIGTTRGVMDAMARLADFAAFCKTNGIVLVVSTPVPHGTIGVNEQYRVAIRDAVRAMGNSGQFIVADFTSVTSAGGSPETWLPGLNSDNLHPSDAGYEAMAGVAKQAIIKALSGV